MELLVVRHAKAAPQGSGPDEERPLTPEGHAQAESIGRALAKFDFLPGKIFSSPLVRARQTVGAILVGAGREIDTEFTPALRPGCSSKAVQEYLGAWVGRGDRLMIVGHQPDLGNFIAAVVAGGHAGVQLSPGALARIDLERPDVDWSGYLVWLWSPDLPQKIHG